MVLSLFGKYLLLKLLTCFGDVIFPFRIWIAECWFLTIACSDLDSYNVRLEIWKCENCYLDVLRVHRTPICSIINFRDWCCVVVSVVIYGNGRTLTCLLYEGLGIDTVCYVLKLVQGFEGVMCQYKVVL